MKEKELDQFYTKDEIGNDCTKTLLYLFDKTNYTFLEPSAGGGAFIRALLGNTGSNTIIGVDLDPHYPSIIQQDFLSSTPSLLNLPNKEDVITIGNPPFGKRSKLAIEFFNHAAIMSNAIAFIIPMQWNKWSVQSKLNNEFKLIHNETLQEDAFTFKDKPYKVRCVFQIWTRDETPYLNLRLTESPSISHEDFEMYQYNNTPQAEKYFTYDFDFAVPRQGYYDYTLRETDESKMNRKIQWIFFKAKDKQTLKNLHQMNFANLARKNTTVLGFGKADVVEEYSRLYK
jgi:predicted RNA methylase